MMILTDEVMRATIIESSFGQIEQGVDYVRKSDLLDKEVFLEHTVVELVYKFDEKSTTNV